MKKEHIVIMTILCIITTTRLFAQDQDSDIQYINPTTKRIEKIIQQKVYTYDSSIVSKKNKAAKIITMDNPVEKTQTDTIFIDRLLHEPVYPFTYINNTGKKQKKIMIPNENFAPISARYFSFLAAGQDVTTPAVSNFSIDLLDAKFDLKGGVGFYDNRFLLNVAISGDKEGNIATLFEDKKTGGKFESELKLSWSPYKFRKFTFSKEEDTKIWDKIREVDYKYYSDYLSIKKNCPPKPKPCDSIYKNDPFLSTFTRNSYEEMQAIIDSAKAKRQEVFNSAEWVSIRAAWVTAKFKVGGDKVYSITQTPNYINDTIRKNNLLTAYAGLEFNFYYTHSKGFTFYANAGLGYERSNNASDLDKVTVTQSVSMKDTTVKDPNSQKRDISAKYDAFAGEIKSTDNISGYLNIYTLFGVKQPFGVHLGIEGKSNLKDGADKISNVALTTGLIGNVSKKGDTKSVVSVEIFLKLNRINKSATIEADNERHTQIGMTFNVPIPSIPKK